MTEIDGPTTEHDEQPEGAAATGEPEPPTPRPAPPGGTVTPATVHPSPGSLLSPTRQSAHAGTAPAPATFGRVDETGAVFVRTRDGERQVGQWASGDQDAALAFYVKRYEGLSVEVDLLARRISAGSLSPEEATATVAKVHTAVVEAQAVGDLDGLADRLDSLSTVIEEQRAQRRADRAAKADEARHHKQRIAADAEALAEGTDWRNGANRLKQLLDEWKALPRIDKASDDELWRRFSSARTTYTRRRKQHFTELGAKRDDARAAKEQLITEAESMSSSTDWGATSAAYRDLMTRWKAAGSAGRDLDDALWKRFRGAQDVFFEARDAKNSQVDEEYRANADVKRRLLAEAEKLLPVTNPGAARAAFRDLAAQWDRAGKVPRNDVKDLENRFRAIEETIRAAEDARWRSSNPETHARASDTIRKLEASIAALEADLANARAAGDAKKVADAEAAIEARRSWLEQARKAQSEFGG